MTSEMDLLRMDERQRLAWLMANRGTVVAVGVIWMGMIVWELAQGRAPLFLIVMVPVLALLRVGCTSTTPEHRRIREAVPRLAGSGPTSRSSLPSCWRSHSSCRCTASSPRRADGCWRTGRGGMAMRGSSSSTMPWQRFRWPSRSSGPLRFCSSCADSPAAGRRCSFTYSSPCSPPRLPS